ncbi:MAG: glycosyltransferase family 4 protein [Candidatus Aminicenantes bacterium]|nr:glycosyltransferase family 4 protein [Candidatus Aminicenantes bacterium]
MKKILLFHGGKIQPYRISVYNYLHIYLKKFGYCLTVVSEGCQPFFELSVNFPSIEISFSLLSLMKLISAYDPFANILFINHRERYYYPLLIYLKGSGKKTITWTHGINLQNKQDKLSRMAHHIEHFLCDRIILYSEDIKKYLLRSHRHKSFVANNTLNLADYIPQREKKREILDLYNISTGKNIVYSGRIDLRKRIFDLLKAFELIKVKDVGLIIIGPDENGILKGKIRQESNIFYLGPIYGRSALDVLSASDICCIPGAVGLGIVDSMYCGLPLVTENVDHGPEIMYFKDGVNGFMVPKGDVVALTEKLSQLLTDDDLREKLSRNARAEILTRGHIDNLCAGFLACLKSLES